MVDAKFEFGYSVTIEMGSEKWKGVLYHIPSESELPNDTDQNQNQNHTVICQSQNDYGDPARFEESGIGYRYFYDEIWKKLEPLYGRELEAMNKKIGLIWDRLSEAEKQVRIQS